jgi:hypothetical protein
MVALPTINRGTLPDVAPMPAGTIATRTTDQQWRLNIPSNDSSPSPLAVQLTNAGGLGHWQVRLTVDGLTRSQLTPNLDRLRDKLRQRSGNRIDDFGFDDDSGSESDAAA